MAVLQKVVVGGRLRLSVFLVVLEPASLAVLARAPNQPKEAMIDVYIFLNVESVWKCEMCNSVLQQVRQTNVSKYLDLPAHSIRHVHVCSSWLSALSVCKENLTK